MEQKQPIPTERLRTIRGQMVERFTLDELRDLTFDLGINWEQLSGDTLDGKTTSLLERLNRQARFPALLAQLHTLRPNVPWALDDLDEVVTPPYKGLAFYDRRDAGLFFGRERVIGELVVLTGKRSFVAVVGKSGSGKSSVVRAGVVPVLRGDRPPPEGIAPTPDCQRWVYLEMTPTARPAEQLAITLTRDLTTAAETQPVLEDIGKVPSTASLYLSKYLERQSAPRAFLFVDQFEELYTICEDETARAAFNAGLLAVAESGRATVFITLRADFLHRFIDYPQLWEALDQNKFVIRAMNEDELREAVEQPALTTGYELEPGLSDVIVRDVGQDAATLPLLSHALLETWRRREGWVLTHAGYNAAGGVGGAIARTAERAYAGLDPEQQKIARRIFLELTELGEGAEDTRRSVPLSELLPDDPTNRAVAEVVLDALYRARLVTADAETAQVTHEAIIREWPALREWLRDNREALRLERRLEDAAAQWASGDRDPSYLYGGAQLAAARQWAIDNSDNVSPTVRDFLRAATAEEEREAAEREVARRERERLVRRSLVGASVFAALVTIAALIAVLQWRDATNALNDSNARLLLNESQNLFESDPLLADRLLLEAILTANSEASRNEVRAALTRSLSSSRVTTPITSTTLSAFTAVHTDTAYVVDYLMERDVLISGTSGSVIATLDGDVDLVHSFPDNFHFVVGYSDNNTASQLRWTNDIAQVVQLRGDADAIFPFSDSPFFVVSYSDTNMESELRTTDDITQAVRLQGDVDAVFPFPDSPYFVVTYSGANPASELRRTDNIEQAAPLSNNVDEVITFPNSPFFIVSYSNVHPSYELLQTDDIGQVSVAARFIESVTFLADKSYFLVNYPDRYLPSELRLTEDPGDPEQVVRLSGDVSRVTPLNDSRFFVVEYSDPNTPSELRRTDDAAQAVKLSGDVRHVTSLSDRRFFVVQYSDSNTPGELRRTDDAAEVVALSGDVRHVTSLNDSRYFVVQYSDSNTPGELRRTDNVTQVIRLRSGIDSVTAVPNSPYFVIGYSDFNTVSELRRTDDVTQIITLRGDVDSFASIPNSPFFLVGYSDYNTASELLYTDNPAKIVTLIGDVDDINPMPNSPFFAISYSNAPRELRWRDTAKVVADANGRRTAYDAALLGTGELGYYWIMYQDGTAAIASGDRSLVTLEPGVKKPLYFPGTNRVAVLYSDGRVVYIDIDLIEALGGADAAKTLTDMSTEKLVTFTCQNLFTDNPVWDEAKLTAELADILPGWEPRACRE